jgi:hypothetical protein
MITRLLLVAAVFSLPLSLRAETGTPPAKDYSAYLIGNLSTLRSKVVAIDPELRQIALQSDKGHIEVITAGPEMVNFPQIKVGDNVTFKIQETLSFLHLKPGAVPPPSETAGQDFSRAVPGSKPSASVTDYAQVITLVDALDPAVPSVSLKYPDGSVRTFKLKDASRLANVAKGDTVIITATRKVAASVTAAN